MAITPPETYFRVRTRAYSFARACERSYISFLAWSKEISEFPPVEDYSEEFEHLKDQKEDTGVQTIVLSAMCLEAAIFDYAAIHLGDAYVSDHLDKIDLLSKWVIVMRFVSDHHYEKGEEPYNSLKQLVTARNRLVHSKSEAFDHYNSERQVDRLFAESEQFDRDVHNAFRAMVLISMDYEMNQGSEHNPLSYFSQAKKYDHSPLKEVVSACRRVIKNRCDQSDKRSP